MGAFSIWHILIAIGVASLLLGGGGRLSGMMGDVAQGVRDFRNGLKEDPPVEPPAAEG
ncbi:twin-arginine translocase TatA/TatE family subunit [Phenylobacterium sp. LjRoot225]|uniref:twin-arginine translocase TatA/TatE family subunit n=1 Tax=Phenylobacterium sp. LjRoot225 TaxID=3342285 RepID=UPI003ECDDE1D